MVLEIQAKNFKLLWKIRKILLKMICTIGNPEKIKENSINPGADQNCYKSFKNRSNSGLNLVLIQI